MKADLNVKLISHTMNPEEIIAVAGKLCYSPSSIEDLISKQSEETINKFINMLVSIGHESPLEHCVFNFAIEGVSRSLTHQLVRHRIASYSQQSQRYVKEGDNFKFIVPQVISDMGKEAEYEKDMKLIHLIYQKWQENIKDFVEDNNYPTNGMNAEKVANENARYILPNACETKIICTMNLRTLINFCHHRCCRRAQDEIHKLAWAMVKEIEKVSPLLARSLGASCQFGPCPEGKMCCGRPFEKK